MNARIKISALLVGVGLILAFLPFNAAKSFQLKPTELLEISTNTDMYFSVDEVARFVNNEDTTIQLIDLRSAAEFMESNIPGSINIPFSDLLNPSWEGYLDQDKVKNVYYANGDETANLVWAIVSGLGYSNSFVMKGGMNEWYKTVMLSKFEGDRITPRENALFENRYKARRTFTQINSLPDSLKKQYLEAKRLEESQLDGGCE
ncbi:rhodanese-like domain-containing protein [Draconibacterium sp. IB214405]|uniref:rhodanese-like domain-containing protein n=1 Tax=Draconibacterium sp. IB214405 TaxID=3097352 RepID=UPI002A113F8A|nr:rhodanese-like domain-containing protein [Draconibacterium sp. IB214405]MDX8338113.1 rhodanese-like domain-containing protein [Draconibacterium sp. IB214405]